ncbi:MAG: response regulator [Chitinispirillia bacterium]|jgi:CheY-like chemotaxis protein
MSKYSNNISETPDYMGRFKENLSVKEIIDECIRFSLSVSNIDYKLELPAGLWNIDMDRIQIVQVINNILINAEQAMADGGTIIIKGCNVWINRNISDDINSYLPLNSGPYVKISIKDKGAGIPPNIIRKIYNSNFTTKKNHKGLGLTICNSILKKYNGLIFCKSIPGFGTTFHIHFPAYKEHNNEYCNDIDNLKKSRTILVMDDELVVRNAAGKALVAIGYNVAYAEEGLQAIELYKNALESGKPFDAVILDLTIHSGMGGKETMRKLLEIDPDIKVIVSSGYSHDPVLTHYKEYGFKDVIKKPYLVQDLHRILDSVLDDNS